jgi:hypothetical protein
MRYLKEFNGFGAKVLEAKTKKGDYEVVKTGLQQMNNAFKKSIWKERFSALGFDLPSMALGQLIFEPDNYCKEGKPFHELENFMDPEPEPDYEGPDQVWPVWPTINVPEICVEVNDAEGKKVSVEIHGKYNNLFIDGLTTQSLEEIENIIMKEYIKVLKKAEIQGAAPGQHPVLKMMIDAFEGKIPLDMSYYFSLAVKHDPVLITKIPKKYLEKVKVLTGFSSDQITGIDSLKDIGIF